MWTCHSVKSKYMKACGHILMPFNCHNNPSFEAGMIIFFDWDSPDGESGPQDGLSDHTGIVQKVENGIVYTVEGNSGDSVRQKQYSVGYYEILGYGVPQY